MMKHRLGILHPEITQGEKHLLDYSITDDQELPVVAELGKRGMRSQGCLRENNSRNGLELSGYTCHVVILLWPSILTVISQDSNTKGYFQALCASIWKSTGLFMCVVRALRPTFDQSHSKPSGGIRNPGQDSDCRLNYLCGIYWRLFRLKTCRAHLIVDNYIYLYYLFIGLGPESVA